MSGLFKQINDMSAQQRQEWEQVSTPSSPSPVRQKRAIADESEISRAAEIPQNSPKPPKKVVPRHHNVAPQSGTERIGLEMEKLQTIIQELSQLPVGSNGLNVRMSEQEIKDIEDFIFGTLRKEGLKGYEVSTAKLMRYSLRYLFRVHPKEFIAALKEALKTEEKLSI